MAWKIKEFTFPNVPYGGLDNIQPGTPVAEQNALAKGYISAAFNAATNVILIQTDTDMTVKFGGTPTADANSQTIYANKDAWFRVIPGEKVDSF